METLDLELNIVKNALTSNLYLNEQCRIATKGALVWAIDGINTGRASINELFKAEKTVIGIKLEYLLKKHLGLPEGKILDCEISNVEFDIKFTCGKTWMIPPECYRIQGICLLVKANDTEFSVGLLRTLPENLTSGSNQDKKKTINKNGQKNIDWLILNHKIGKEFSHD